MPNYSSLSTQIDAIKSEISSSLAASAYSAQDLVYVAKALQALGSVVAPDGVSNITVNDNIYLGTAAEAFATTAALTNPNLVIAVTETDYAQIAFTNRSSNANASTDIILYSNNGTDASGYIDMGITSSNFADPDFTITGRGDGYIFMVGAEAGTTDRGNLVFATSDTGTQNKIIFAAGGLASDNEQMSITPDQNVHIEIDTPSTSPTTGALTVVGGVGISGDVNIDGTITFGGAGTTVETSNLAVTDPLVFTGNANQGDALDLGLIGEYATSVSTVTATVSNKALASDVATITTSAAHGFVAGDIVVITGVDATFNGTHYITGAPTATTFTFVKDAANVTSAAATGSAAVSLKRRFAAVARDASDGVIKFITDITTKPTTTINFSEAGTSYADIRVDDITADAITATSATIGDVSNTEIQYLNNVTSNIQTQLDAKLASATASSTYAPINNASFTGTVALPSTTSIGTVSDAEIACLDGVTSPIQNQLGNKLDSSTAASTYAPLTNASLVSPVLQSPEEVITVSATAATGTINVDLASSAIHYYTANSAADFTFNFRGNGSTTLNSMLNVGGTISVAFMVTNGSTAYKPLTTGAGPVQIDGVTVTPKWNGGAAPSIGSTNSIDVYTFTIIKTASATYTVLGTQSKFA
jgi:hypothetical protein